MHSEDEKASDTASHANSRMQLAVALASTPKLCKTATNAGHDKSVGGCVVLTRAAARAWCTHRAVGRQSTGDAGFHASWSSCSTAPSPTLPST